MPDCTEWRGDDYSIQRVTSDVFILGTSLDLGSRLQLNSVDSVVICLCHPKPSCRFDPFREIPFALRHKNLQNLCFAVASSFHMCLYPGGLPILFSFPSHLGPLSPRFSFSSLCEQMAKTSRSFLSLQEFGSQTIGIRFGALTGG